MRRQRGLRLGVDCVQGGANRNSATAPGPRCSVTGLRWVTGHSALFGFLTEVANARALCIFVCECDMRTRSKDAVPPAFRRCGRTRACKLTGVDNQNHVKNRQITDEN